MLVGICDDEKKEIKRYSKLFTEFSTKREFDVNIVVYKSGDKLLFNEEDVIRQVDVLFLDINMPGTNGLETASKLRNHGYEGEIVFLTQSKDKVFYAFDVRALNYIVKDETPVERVESIFFTALKEAKDRKSEYLLLTGVGEFRNVAINEIKYFEIMQKIVTVYYNNEKFEFVSTMGKLENLLFNKGFVRVSRSFLVSVNHIASFSYEKISMASGDVIPVGRKYYKDLKEAMNGRESVK